MGFGVVREEVSLLLARLGLASYRWDWVRSGLSRRNWAHVGGVWSCLWWLLGLISMRSGSDPDDARSCSRWLLILFSPRRLAFSFAVATQLPYGGSALFTALLPASLLLHPCSRDDLCSSFMFVLHAAASNRAIVARSHALVRTSTPSRGPACLEHSVVRSGSIIEFDLNTRIDACAIVFSSGQSSGCMPNTKFCRAVDKSAFDLLFKRLRCSSPPSPLCPRFRLQC